jgi:membrane protease YdiL (CAAX protease family)
MRSQMTVSRSSHIFSVVRVCATGSALAILFSVILAVPPRLNVLIFPGVFWFVVPVGWLTWKCFEWSRPPVSTIDGATLRGERAALVSSGAGIALGVMAVWESGVHLTMNGLPGASLTGASVWMQAAWSCVDLISGAVTEECAVRGWIQFPLRPLIGDIYAEVAADLIFVALHSLRFSEAGSVAQAPPELVFVLTVGAVNGRITSKTRSLTWPILVHTLCNGIVFAVALD